MTKTPRTRTRFHGPGTLLLGAAVTLASSFVRGQTAGSPSAAADSAALPRSSVPVVRQAPSDPDAAYQLSPFVVHAGEETGYLATSTLAGTRLNTPLKDLGASISVYTKQFMDDVGAENLNELLVYATGMEAAGEQGNFSGATGGDINVAEPTGEATRLQPQQSTRTRGLAEPNFTRDYFLSDMTIDAYNTEDVTVSRGPNSMLFGIGSPAGVVNTGLIKPRLDRDRDALQVRFGSHGSARGSLDLNRAIIPGKLAIRLAGLEDDDEDNQRPAFTTQRRLFGAVTAQPFPSTVVRANFETGYVHANRPFTVLPLDSISNYWLAAGRPTYNWLDYATTPARTNYTGPFIGHGQVFSGIVYSFPVNATMPNFAYPATINSGSGSYTYRAGLPDPSFGGRSLASGSIIWGETLNVGEIPASFWPGGVKPAGLKYQGFTDYSYFPWDKEELDPTSRQGESFHTYTVYLEQRAWHDRLGFEGAYYHERYDRRTTDSFETFGGSDQIRVDPSVTLPNGQPNPNLGRPYIATGQSNWPHYFVQRDAVRGTGYFRYDFRDLSPTLGAWLGRHTLTGVAEQNADDIISYKTGLFDFGAYSDAISSNPQNFNRIPYLASYIGDSVLGGGPIRLQPTHAQVVPGATSPVTYYYDPNGSSAVGSFTQAPSSLQELTTGGSANREVIRSAAAVLQSYWASDLLVTTLGIRRDTDHAVSIPITYLANPNKAVYGFNDFAFPSVPPTLDGKTVESGSAELAWPQQLWPLPWGADASVFVNQAQNFTPSGTRVDPYNRQLPSPQGKTREIGLNLSFFRSRLVFRYDHFETRVDNQSYSNPAYGVAVNNGTYQLARNWYSDMNGNPQNISYVQADIDTLFSTLPSNFRSLYQYTLTGTAAAQTLTLSDTPLASLADTTSFVAKGHELDVVYNPTSQWRILANFATQNVVQSNIAPNFKQFVSVMKPVWDQLSGRAFTGTSGTYPIGYVWGSPLPSTTTTVGQWALQNVYVPLATIQASEGISSAEIRKYRFNLVANYTFSSGTWLRGWSVGSGLRWQSKLGIGYPMSYNPDNSINVQIHHPYYAPPLTNLDSWIGYRRKLWDGRIDWNVQLSAKNLIGQTDPIPITVQPWGQTAAARLPPEKRWYLTNEFDF